MSTSNQHRMKPRIGTVKLKKKKGFQPKRHWAGENRQRRSRTMQSDTKPVTKSSEGISKMNRALEKMKKIP